MNLPAEVRSGRCAPNRRIINLEGTVAATNNELETRGDRGCDQHTAGTRHYLCRQLARDSFRQQIYNNSGRRLH